ncbi:hypothetical protein [Paenibacillus caui]|uniref:hypothetical protein n=1 Tax=Paenibacillus caui TaxID=2873927 RepID=UPI001CA9E0CA|nr:hypothetical protein [Paenibacillus caui]
MDTEARSFGAGLASEKGMEFMLLCSDLSVCPKFYLSHWHFWRLITDKENNPLPDKGVIHEISG